MSVLTSNALIPAPSAANSVTVSSSAGASWSNGAWSEFIASTAGATTIAGIANGDGNTGQEVEIEFGVGAAAAEVAIGVWRVFFGNSGGTPASQHFEPPYPLGGIGTGVRVAIRIRKNVSSSTTVKLKINYYTALSSDQQTLSTQVYSAAPPAANGASVTASTTDWANSAYAELTSGLAASSAFYGLETNFPNAADIDLEFDIATGGAGSEVVKTTLRCSMTTAGAFGGMLAQILVAGYVVPASTRVAVRLRKAGTAAGAYTVAGLYISNVTSGSRGKAKGKGRGNPGITQYTPGGARIINLGNPGIGYSY